MKKIILSATIIFIISLYFFWRNRYVELYPVVLEDEYIVNTKEIPVNFYKNIQTVLDYYNEDYKLKENIILIKNKKMRDLELIYNYTKKSKDSTWLSNRKQFR